MGDVEAGSVAASDLPVHPRPDRKLPPELRPPAVWAQAAAFPDGIRGEAFADLIRRIDASPLFERNEVRLYFRGKDAFAAMREAIDGAEHEVLAESYIWKDDATGNAVLETLGRAAARGVSVRVLADAWGSLTTRREYWRRMRELGIETRLFHPVFPQLFLQPYRDHRKILVVDRRVGFTGGMNVSDEFSGGSSGGSRGGPWRDTHARARGSSARELSVVFWEAWSRAGGGPYPPLAATAETPGRSRILVLDSRPGRGHGETTSVLTAIAAAARERLWITNAYFAPGPRAIERLAATSRRGVDVRLLLPGPTDVPLVRHAGHGSFETLLRAGVRIFEYQPAILHAKTIVADGHVSFVGSSNLDFRSFHLNAESNFVILCDEVAGTLAGQFEEDLKHSAEIGPIWRRSMLHRVGDSIARTLAPLL